MTLSPAVESFTTEEGVLLSAFVRLFFFLFFDGVLDTYAHVTERMKRDSAERMDRFIALVSGEGEQSA